MIKERIKNKEKLCGTHLTMGNFWIADILALSGVDYVWVDTEHSCIDYTALLECITVLKANGVAVFVRTQMNDYNHTKKILEMGIDGIIFPMVESLEQAEECMKYTFYPPKGNRGFSPARAVLYGYKDATQYIKNEDNLCRFVQVESPKAVENLENTIKNNDIDGFIIGPCDMSVSGGTYTDLWSENNVNLIEKTIKILKENDKYIGVSIGAYDKQTQKRWFDMGVDMLSSGTDVSFIVDGATANAKNLFELLGRK